jgi:hypothetical protein
VDPSDARCVTSKLLVVRRLYICNVILQYEVGPRPTTYHVAIAIYNLQSIMSGSLLITDKGARRGGLILLILVVYLDLPVPVPGYIGTTAVVIPYQFDIKLNHDHQTHDRGSTGCPHGPPHVARNEFSRAAIFFRIRRSGTSYDS